MVGNLNIGSRLQKLDGHEFLRVFPTMELEEVASHGTEIVTLFEMALMVGPPAGHGLHLVGGGGGPAHVVCILTLLLV